jgi:hypothetical protein
MISMPDQIKSDGDCDYWGKRMAAELTKLFPEGINMQFENKARMFNIKKKAYWYYLLDGKGGFVMDPKTGKPKMTEKGVLSARRDNAGVCRDIYHESAHQIMQQHPVENVIMYAYSEATKLVSGKIKLKRLEITRAMGANYKNASATMKVFGDELRAIGRPAQPGDRLSYVVVKKPGVKLLGKRMMLTSMYLESLKTETPAEIDYGYYLKNILSHHYDQAFSLAYPREIEFLKYRGIQYRPTNRHKFIQMDNPILMLSSMFTAGFNFEDKLKEILYTISEYRWYLSSHLLTTPAAQPVIEFEIEDEDSAPSSSTAVVPVASSSCQIDIDDEIEMYF